jgi:hypothetical protein
MGLKKPTPSTVVSAAGVAHPTTANIRVIKSTLFMIICFNSYSS